jgi:Tfp pilus assembly protein PilN
MIQINLLPGARKSTKARGASSLAALKAIVAQVKDPFLVAAVTSIGVAGTAVTFLYTAQAARAADVAERERAAVQDSTRYAAVLAERDRAQAQVDSVTRQIAVIRAIDNNRYVWPHVMDEVSRALPQFTWLTSIQQTSEPVFPAAATDTAKADAKAKAAEGDEESAAKSAKPKAPEPPAALKFAIKGNTVDIQALTRFMRVLEASPFVQNVTLAKSALIVLDGREITDFQLDAEYQTPDPTAIQTVPVTLSVR